MQIGRMWIIVGIATGLCGCIGSKVVWYDSVDGKTDRPGGKYSIETTTKLKSLAVELEERYGIATACRNSAKIPDISDPLPITISRDCSSERNSLGGLSVANNIVSFCTLGVWPWINSKETDICVSVKTPNGEWSRHGSVGVRAWSSYILPIGGCPCPGVGDRRENMLFSEKIGKNFGIEASVKPEMMDEAMVMLASGLLTEDFYKREMSQWVDKIHKVMPKLKKLPKEFQKPILLIDEKDVVNQTDRMDVDITDVASRVENELNSLKIFKIVSKRAVERGLAESQLFQVIAGETPNLSEIKVPAYRIEIDIIQYDVSRTVQDIKEWVKSADYGAIGKLTRVSANAELIVKVTNLRTGASEFSDKVHAQVGDSSEVKTIKHQSSVEEVRGKKLNADSYYLSAALNKAIDDFATRLSSKQTYHIVGCNNGGTVVVDIPATVTSIGDEFTVYDIDADTDVETEVATIRIVGLQGRKCTAEFVAIKDAECPWNVVVKPK